MKAYHLRMIYECIFLNTDSEFDSSRDIYYSTDAVGKNAVVSFIEKLREKNYRWYFCCICWFDR